MRVSNGVPPTFAPIANSGGVLAHRARGKLLEETAGLVNLYRARAISAASGSVVSTWPDSGPSPADLIGGNVLFDQSGINGQPALRWDTANGTPFALAGFSQPKSAITIVVTCRPGKSALTGNSGLIGFDTQGVSLYWHSGNLVAFDGTSATSGTLAVTHPAPCVCMWIYDSTLNGGTGGMRLRVNGVELATGTYSCAGVLSALKVGGGGGQVAFNGMIGDVAIIGRAVGASECAAIEQALYDQYQISTLPDLMRDAVVWMSNSIGTGCHATSSARGWVEQTMSRMGRATWDYRNYSQNGIQSSALDTLRATTSTPAYHSGRANNVAVAFEATNDTTFAHYTTLVTNLAATGYAVIAATPLSRNQAGYGATNDTARTTGNATIRAASGFVELADVGNDPRLGQSAGITQSDGSTTSTASYANTTYFDDGIHPTDAGHAILAEHFYWAIQRYLKILPVLEIPPLLTNGTTAYAKKFTLADNTTYNLNVRVTARDTFNPARNMVANYNYLIQVSGGAITITAVGTNTPTRNGFTTADFSLSASGLVLSFVYTGEVNNSIGWKTTYSLLPDA